MKAPASQGWHATTASEVEGGSEMIDPPSGCVVRVRRKELLSDGRVALEYEPSRVAVGFITDADRVIRSRKVG